jgi:hypothetical protein
MLKNINEKVQKIWGLPRLPRREVAKILKEIYKEGFKDGRKLSINELKKYE